MYHDLYVKSNTFLLADVFENFRNMYLEIYKLDSAKCLSAPQLACQAALKETKIKLDLLADIDMSLMVKQVLRGEICHSIYRCAKAINKYMKDYNKNKELLFIQYWYVHNLYDWEMPQKVPVNNFRWIRYTSQCNEDFIKIYNEESNEGYFLEVDDVYFLENDVQYLGKLHEFHNDLPFLPQRMKIEKVEKFVANLHDKTEYITHIRNLKQALHYGLVLKLDIK